MTKPKSVPSVSIYWNRSEKYFLVQQTAPITTGAFAGASGDFGIPTRVPEKDFDSSIASLVIDSLAAFQIHEYEKDSAPHLTEKEQLDFAKQHLLVNVAEIHSGQIRISACERHGGSYSGVKGSEVFLNVSSDGETLSHVLRESFQQAR